MVTETSGKIQNMIERHRAFWNRDPVDRPLFCIRGGPRIFGLQQFPVDLGGEYLHPENIHPEAFLQRYDWSGPFAGENDIFSPVGPVGLSWVESILGCPIQVGEESTWAEPIDWTWDALLSLEIDDDNPWLRKLVEFTEALVERANGITPVHHTLMRGPADMVSGLMGNPEMCLQIFDNPDKLKVLLDRCADLWIKINRAQRAVIPEFHGGYCNNFGLWTPGTNLRTQEDSGFVLSPSHYRSFLQGPDRKIFGSVEFSTISIHSGAVHLLDAVREADELTAIQVSLDEETLPSLDRWMPILQRVQENKCLIIRNNCELEHFKKFATSLSPVGLLIDVRLEEGVEEARDWLRQRWGWGKT